MMEHVRAAPPTTSVFPGRVLWATLHAIDDDDLGVAASGPRTPRRSGASGCPSSRLACRADRGRRPGPDRATAAGATALMADVRASAAAPRLSYAPMHVQAAADRAGRAARRLGRPGHAGCARRRRSSPRAATTALARRCRTMLGEAGAPMPRRGRGDSDVPTALRGARRDQPGGRRAQARRDGPVEPGDRRAAVPVAEDRRAAPVGSLFGRAPVPPNRAALAALARAHGLQTG